jgi:hypothetical protein
MALTLRSNGSTSSNLVTAAWWNDYYNLLTGTMTDQPVTVADNVTLKPMGADPGAPTLTVVAGTGLGVGVYQYGVTLVGPDGGESLLGTTASATTTSGNQQINLSAIPTGPTGTTARKVYRTKVGASTFFLLTTLADNSTTTLSDTTADTALPTTTPPKHPTFGGSLLIQDASSNPRVQFYPDGFGAISGLFYLDHTAVNGEGADSCYVGVLANGTNVVDTYLANNAAGNIVLYTGNTQHGLWLRDSSGFYLSAIRGSGNNVSIENRAGGAIGFKVSGVPKAEIRTNGNFIISGTTYQTTAGSVSTQASQTFDAFDVAEVYQADQNYPKGTVLTLGPASILTRNLTDGNPIAFVVVDTPAFGIGVSDPASNLLYCSLGGTVAINTPATITAGQLVCADNNGGCRPLAAGEWQQIIGVAITDSANGQVGVFLRPTYAKG